MRRNGMQTQADRERVPAWALELAQKWAEAEGGPVPMDTKNIVRTYFRLWRRHMGLARRTQLEQPLTMEQAAAWIDTPKRSWESWECGRRWAPPCVYGWLRALLRDARAVGGNHAEDDPANKRPAGSAGIGHVRPLDYPGVNKWPNK